MRNLQTGDKFAIFWPKPRAPSRTTVAKYKPRARSYYFELPMRILRAKILQIPTLYELNIRSAAPVQSLLGGRRIWQ